MEERMLAQVTAYPVKVWIAENPRFPWQWLSSKGKSVLRSWRKPQPMDKQVNIPALVIVSMAKRRVVSRADYWISVFDISVVRRQIRAQE